MLRALKVHRTPNTAAMQYSVEIAELLVKHGCSPAVHDNSGLTPVMYAVQQVAFHSEYFVCFVHTCFFRLAVDLLWCCRIVFSQLTYHLMICSLGTSAHILVDMSTTCINVICLLNTFIVFSQQVVNVWNSLPDSVDFTSFACSYSDSAEFDVR